MAIVQQTDGGLDNVAAMEMVRSGQIPDIAIDSEGLVVGFQRKEHRMTLRLLTQETGTLKRKNRLLRKDNEFGGY